MIPVEIASLGLLVLGLLFSIDSLALNTTFLLMNKPTGISHEQQYVCLAVKNTQLLNIVLPVLCEVL